MTPRALCHTTPLALVLALLVGVPSAALAQRGNRPTRDAAASAPTVAAGTASISGVVRALDTGRPVRRARVWVTSGSGPVNARATTTGDDGRFELKELAEGRYTLSVSKPGYVTLAYGQKRPRQPALPLQLRAGERLANLGVLLPRGGVISGHVLDDQGAPLVSATVQVQRYEYRLGERRLLPEGLSRTDDRGEYRVFGLPPGEYYVSATAPPEGRVPGGGPGPGGPGGPFGPGGVAFDSGTGPLRPGIIVPGDSGADEAPTDFAPTYYPGVPTVTDSGRVTLGLSQELTNLDFALQLVPTARVSGTVLPPEGRTLRFATVGLITELGLPVAGRQQRRVGSDGTFTMTGVPPGNYRLVARGQAEGVDGPLLTTMPLSVSGGTISGLSVALRMGADLPGTIVFEGGAPDATLLSRFTVAIRGTDSSAGPLVLNTGNVGPDLRFVVRNVSPGPKVVQLQRAPQGWVLRDVRLGSADVSDIPFDVQTNTPIGALSLVLTNATATVSGVVRNGRGEPASDYTAILFPADATQWHPLSRRIAAKRADQLGQYEFQNLVPGRYLLAAVDLVEEGQWTDPAFLERIRARAVDVQIDGGGRVARDVTGVDVP